MFWNYIRFCLVIELFNIEFYFFFWLCIVDIYIYINNFFLYSRKLYFIIFDEKDVNSLLGKDKDFLFF